jgi:hypothetical protein
MLPEYGIMNPSSLLKIARPPGSERSRSHCERSLVPGEEVDIPDAI